MSNLIFGYCRISRKTQNIDRQVRNIIELYPNAQITKEAFTGTKIIGRKGFEKILNKVQSGDTIVFDSVSRMSRNAQEGFTLYKELFEKGVKLVFLKERHIDTDSYKQALDGIISTSFELGDTAATELVNAIMDAVNKFMMNKIEQDIYKAFEQAQKEVDDLHQRTKEGMETARRNGKQIGQKKGKKLTVKKEAPAKAIIKEYSKAFGGNLKDDACIKISGVSRATYYKYKAELLAEE